MLMVIYHYVERICGIIVTPYFCITYTILKDYYPGEPVNIHTQSSINIIQEKIGKVPPKKGKVRLEIFCCNIKQSITIYAWKEIGGLNKC